MTDFVKELYQKIESLSEKDRLTLDKMLARKLGQEWHSQAKKVRKIARKRGITMAGIDRAIDRRRYPAAPPSQRTSPVPKI